MRPLDAFDAHRFGLAETFSFLAVLDNCLLPTCLDRILKSDIQLPQVGTLLVLYVVGAVGVVTTVFCVGGTPMRLVVRVFVHRSTLIIGG